MIVTKFFSNKNLIWKTTENQLDRFNLMLLCVSKSTLSRPSYLNTTSVVQMFYPLKYIFRLPITSKRTTNKKEGHCPRFTAQQRQFWLQMITLGKGTLSLKTYTFSIGGIT